MVEAGYARYIPSYHGGGLNVGAAEDGNANLV